MITTLFGCLLVLTLEPMSPGVLRDRLPVCADLAERAVRSGLDPALMVSIAWVESRFDGKAVSRAGAVGIMQVLPRYFCPKRRARGCDLVAAGLDAFARWRRNSRTVFETLCRYNAGWRCGRRGRYYARSVLRIRRRIAFAFAFVAFECGDSGVDCIKWNR